MSHAIRFVPAALATAALLAVSGAVVAAPGDAYQTPLTTYHNTTARSAQPVNVGAGQMTDGQILHVSDSDGNPAHIDRLSAYYGN